MPRPGEILLRSLFRPLAPWAVLIVLCAAPAEANERGGSSLSVGFINVDWYPFQYDVDTQVKGFAIDVVGAVLAQMRREVALHPVPFSTGLARLESGELDAYFGLAKNLERIDQFRYSEAPLYVDETVLIGRADEAFVFNGDVSSLIGSRVGVIKGAIHGAAFDNMNGIIRVPHDSGKIRTAQFFHDVLSDKYRFVAVNARAGAVHYLKNLGLQDKLKIFTEPIAVKTYYLVFSNKMPILKRTAKRFNRVHRLFRSTKEYGALLEKYQLSRKLFPR